MSVPQVGIDARGRLVATDVYPWKDAIRDLPGSYFAKVTRSVWAMPPSPEIAARLLTILSGTGARVSPKVLTLVEEHAGRAGRRALLAESAPVPDLPWAKWLKTDPWRHQKRGIVHVSGATAVAVGAGMGTGKSLMVVGAVNRLEIRRAVIVCPAAVTGVWSREFRLHSSHEWHIENGTRRGPLGGQRKLSLQERWAFMVDALTRCRCGRAHAVVLGYEALAKDPVASADMLDLGIEIVVYDEAHRLKAAGGASSLTAFSWVSQIPRRVVMSGTLLPQNPADVYGTYRAIDPGVFGTNETEFLAEWIKMGLTRDGRAYPKDVQRLKKPEFSRRFHSVLYLPTVDLQLPPMIHSIRSVELEPAARAAYNVLRDHGVAEITAAVAEAGGNLTPEGDERTVAPANAGVELLRLAQFTGGATTDDDGNTAVVSKAKGAVLAELLHEVGCRKGGVDGRRNPEPVVVFCKYRYDLKVIQAAAMKAKLRYAEVSGARKDGLDDDSKMNPHCDIVGVQIASGGVGVDFTRAHIAIYFSVGFELWLFQQSQARVHRPGQTRPTLNYYLIVEDSVDGIIYRALTKKENVVNAVVTAYLRGDAEQAVEMLPAMPTEEQGTVGAPVGVPDWLLSPDSPARPEPRPERDDIHRQLTLTGLEGLLG